jgi:hypothetical protein
MQNNKIYTHFFSWWMLISFITERQGMLDWPPLGLPTCGNAMSEAREMAGAVTSPLASESFRVESFRVVPSRPKVVPSHPKVVPSRVACALDLDGLARVWFMHGMEGHWRPALLPFCLAAQTTGTLGRSPTRTHGRWLRRDAGCIVIA